MRGDGSAGDSSRLRNGSGTRQEGGSPSGRAPGASTDPELHSESASPRDPDTRIDWDGLVALAHHMTQCHTAPTRTTGWERPVWLPTVAWSGAAMWRTPPTASPCVRSAVSSAI